MQNYVLICGCKVERGQEFFQVTLKYKQNSNNEKEKSL